MKFGLRTGAQTLRFPIAPVVNIAFLLLMFFMVRLKAVSSERQFIVNLPAFSPTSQPDDELSNIKVGLRSDRNGYLTHLTLNGKNLGKDDAAFERLNREILKIVGRPGNPLAKDIEVELDADYECQHKFVVKAISHCTGRFDPQTQQVARFVEKIKFTPGSKPRA